MYGDPSDAQISPLNATQYYERVVESVGSAEEVRDSYRLFMALGMGHCRGGEGPSVFDKMEPIEAWVEEGRAPDQVPPGSARRRWPRVRASL